MFAWQCGRKQFLDLLPQVIGNSARSLHIDSLPNLLGLQTRFKKFFRKLLKGLRYVPRVIITDKLKSYGAAKAEIMPGVEHRRHKGLNNRAENSHQPTRVRERVMRRFKSAGQAQRFLSAFGIISSHFRPRRHLLTAERYREEMQSRFGTWAEVICVQIAA